MPNINRKLIATYSKVYGDKKEITDGELSVLDKNTWAKVLTRINHLARTRQNYTINQVIGGLAKRIMRMRMGFMIEL
jgi:hypothetical protein